MKTTNQPPAGWDEDRIQRVLAHYESQDEDAATAEDEAAFRHPDSTLMPIPHDLVPEVQRLLALRAR